MTHQTNRTKLYALRTTIGNAGPLYFQALKSGPRRSVIGVVWGPGVDAARGWSVRKELNAFKKKYPFVGGRVVIIERSDSYYADDAGAA